MQSVIISTTISLIFQIIIGILCIHGLSFQLHENKKVLHELLLIESFVQIVEFSFYMLILYILIRKDITNITSIRYFDWFLTTPSMLLAIVVYIIYKNKDSDIVKVSSVVQEHWKVLGLIALCNFLMLVFGYLGETGVISLFASTLIGFVFLFLTFFTIYERFAKNSETEKELLIIFSLWSLYGFAALLEPVSKNNMYNILDMFSKNVMGLFLYYQVRKEYSSYQKV